MKLGETLSILLLTVLGVGILSALGGGLVMSSYLIEGYGDVMGDYMDSLQGYPDLMDSLADLYYSVGGSYENAQSMHNDADDFRSYLWQMQNSITSDFGNLAREYSSLGTYCFVGALLVGIGGASWMTWRFMKEKENPPPRRTQSS